MLDGKNSYLFFHCDSDCYLCIQNSCVHQLFDWGRGVRNLNGIFFSKEVHIKMVDTIKGPSQDRVISFDISQVNSTKFMWSISFYGSRIYMYILLTYISKLPCFVFMFRYGSRHCLSGPWFCCGYQRKLHSHCYFNSLSMGVGFFHMVFSTAVFLQCTWISSNVCLVRSLVVCHILCILCFHWFELLHIMFFGLGLFPCDVV